MVNGSNNRLVEMDCQFQKIAQDQSLIQKYKQFVIKDNNSNNNPVISFKLKIKQVINTKIIANTLNTNKMDRSQVRQFGMNRSIYSSKVMGMSSSILHSPRSNTQRQIHLRKSRIANMPQSKNIDLSQKLDFVVVFQAIQIQRMSQEIQTVRSRIKQYQRQLFNCDNYQIQIKELTQRCYRLESEKNSYREELFDNKRASELIFNELEEIKKRYVTVDFTTNEKYKLEKGRNDQLVLEVEKWKARYNALDQSKSKQLETIKKMMQEQSKSHLSRQTKELFDRFQLQKEQMEQMIRNLKHMNLEKETQLKKCKFQLQNKDKQMDQMERQVDQYEQKVALLSQENYRLSEMTKSKQNQLTKLKDKLKENQQLIAKINQQLFNKTEQHKKIMIKLKKIQQNTNEKEAKLNKLQKAALTDKERLSELDRIVFLLKQREGQIQSKTKMMERKDKKIITLEQSIKSLQQNQTSTKQQILTMKQQSLSASQTIIQLLQRIQHLTSLLKKVKQSAQTSQTQIQTHNTSFREQINKKTQQIIAYSYKLMSQLKQNEDFINKLEDVIKGNAQKVKSMEREKMDALEKLQELKEYQAEYNILEQQNNRLKSKVQQIIQEKDRLLQQNRHLQEHKHALTQEKNNLAKEKNLLLKQKDHLIEQTQMKQSQIMNQTQMQIQMIQEKYENNIIKNLKHQLLGKDKEIGLKDKELNEMRVNLSNMDKRYKQLQKEVMNRESQMKNIIEAKQSQFGNKHRVLSRQVAEKSQLLLKQQKVSNQLKQALQQLTKYYNSGIKVQIQSLLSRIQPIETAIKTIKHIVGQKVITQQKAFTQRQKLHQKQVIQMIDLNLLLMDKNHKLYQSLISSTTTIDPKPLNQHPSSNPQLQHTTINTIYTSSTTNKPLGSPRATNQNYNTSNIVGIGAKIKQTIKGNFSNQTSSNIPVEFLIKYVVLCVQLQSLRQRVGDKNAKVQKMKNSLMVSNVSSNKSFVAVVNGNTKLANQQIHQGQMMLQSNLMSSTLINKLSNPFQNSIVGNMNHQTSFIHQSRLIEPPQRHSGQQLNIRRVISEERYPVGVSPDNSSILENSQHKNLGIYTNRMSGSGMGFGRSGFKSIGIRKAKINN